MKDDEVNPGFDELVGANIRRYRDALGLSQTDLSERLTRPGEPFHQQTVQKIEKGTRPLRLSEAARIAEVLGVSIADFAAVRPTPESVASVAMHRRTIEVVNASGAVDSHLEKLASELLRLARVYAKSAAVQGLDASVGDFARSLLALDWSKWVVETFEERMGGEARGVLADVSGYAEGPRDDVGDVLDSDPFGILRDRRRRLGKGLASLMPHDDQVEGNAAEA